MLKTKMEAELTKFTINTSIEDILTQRSSFNPFPEQAKQGMLVSRSQHPTGNPMMWIKYLATDNVYYVTLPISYEVEEFHVPEILEETAAPSYELEDGTKTERWMPFEDFFFSISRDVVNDAFFEESNFEDALGLAAVRMFDSEGEPVFYEPSKAYVEIVREAFTRLDKGELATAWAIIHVGFNIGAYVIGGERYHDAAYDVFEYTYNNLVEHACPIAVLDNPECVNKRGIHTVLDEVSGEVHSLVVSTLKVRILIKALENSEGVAHDHFERMLEIFEANRRKVQMKLAARSSELVKGSVASNYYVQAVGYFMANGIVL